MNNEQNKHITKQSHIYRPATSTLNSNINHSMYKYSESYGIWFANDPTNA